MLRSLSFDKKITVKLSNIPLYYADNKVIFLLIYNFPLKLLFIEEDKLYIIDNKVILRSSRRSKEIRFGFDKLSKS